MFSLQLHQLKLPPNWEFKVIDTSQYVYAIHWRAFPVENPAVWLGCFATARNVSQSIAEGINAMLSAAPHELTDDEIQLTVWLRQGSPLEFNAPFKPAHLQNLGDYSAIVVRRHWVDIRKQAYEAVIDPHKNGDYTFHFFYAAPDADFDKYWCVAERFFDTVVPDLVTQFKPNPQSKAEK